MRVREGVGVEEGTWGKKPVAAVSTSSPPTSFGSTWKSREPLPSTVAGASPPHCRAAAVADATLQARAGGPLPPPEASVGCRFSASHAELICPGARGNAPKPNDVS